MDVSFQNFLVQFSVRIEADHWLLQVESLKRELTDAHTQLEDLRLAKKELEKYSYNCWFLCL